uniref:Zf-Sec23_Sec24 domain-containing protein n=1 Tax=Macrostomum lignano TaxID=282301 RepID=A0A1I8I076_9PLAT
MSFSMAISAMLTSLLSSGFSASQSASLQDSPLHLNNLSVVNKDWSRCPWTANRCSPSRAMKEFHNGLPRNLASDKLRCFGLSSECQAHVTWPAPASSGTPDPMRQERAEISQNSNAEPVPLDEISKPLAMLMRDAANVDQCGSFNAAQFELSSFEQLKQARAQLGETSSCRWTGRPGQVSNLVDVVIEMGVSGRKQHPTPALAANCANGSDRAVTMSSISKQPALTVGITANNFPRAESHGDRWLMPPAGINSIRSLDNLLMPNSSRSWLRQCSRAPPLPFGSPVSPASHGKQGHQGRTGLTLAGAARQAAAAAGCQNAGARMVFNSSIPKLSQMREPALLEVAGLPICNNQQQGEGRRTVFNARRNWSRGWRHATCSGGVGTQVRVAFGEHLRVAQAGLEQLTASQVRLNCGRLLWRGLIGWVDFAVFARLIGQHWPLCLARRLLWASSAGCRWLDPIRHFSDFPDDLVHTLVRPVELGQLSQFELRVGQADQVSGLQLHGLWPVLVVLLSALDLGPQSLSHNSFCLGQSALMFGNGYLQQPQGYPAPSTANYQPNQLTRSSAQQPGIHQMSPPANIRSPQQQQRSLHPDQMPSAVHVLEDDLRRFQASASLSSSGTCHYESGPANIGRPPPLVTSVDRLIMTDCGSSLPTFMRPTLSSVPRTSDLLKSSGGLAMGLIVAPMMPATKSGSGGSVAIATSGLGGCGGGGEDSIVRCIRCRAYMSPYMAWLDGGRRFQCGFCGARTDTPQSYFAHLDQTGCRVDAAYRPELRLGSYELPAPGLEYRRGDRATFNESPPPGIVFAIDVSYRAVHSGLTALVCDHLRRRLPAFLPSETAPDGQTRISPRVGFLTYDRSVYFYNLSASLSQPQSLIVSDLEEPFAPLGAAISGGFLVDLSSSATLIDQLLESIPQQFAGTAVSDIILGPVVEATLDAFTSCGSVGKLVLLHTGLPTCESAPGKLLQRDNRKLLGTEKESSLLSPVGDYYEALAKRCSDSGLGVDLFVCTDAAYADLATLGQLPFITGGSLYKYASFRSDTHGTQLASDLELAVSNCLAFDCSMRIRTSAGISCSDIHGGFNIVGEGILEAGAFSSDRAVAVELRHDSKLADDDAEPVLAQCALLYTGLSGHRRVRVHNLALATTGQLADMYRSADVDATLNLLVKAALKLLLKKGPLEARSALVSRCVGILTAYRRHCVSAGSSIGQLILPETLKLMPVYVNAIVKSDAFQGADISTDDRSYLMYLCSMMDAVASNVYFYPRLMPVHHLPPSREADDESDSDEAQDGVGDGEESDSADLCELNLKQIRCSVDRLKQNGVYLLENGIVMFLWLGSKVSSTWLLSVFGVNSVANVRCDQTELPRLDTPASRLIRRLVDEIRLRRRRHLRLYIVRPGDKFESWFLNFLVEDRASDFSTSGEGWGSSYVDFLLHVHKEIRSKLG